MPRNTRFASALHVLTLMAVQGEPMTSEFIAGSVCTNAVVVRRLLSRLREAGLVNAVQGPHGGFTLAVDPSHLTLRMVYEALDEQEMISVHSDPNQQCPVGRNIGELLMGIIAKAEGAMLASMELTTVGRLARTIKRREAQV